MYQKLSLFAFSKEVEERILVNKYYPIILLSEKLNEIAKIISSGKSLAKE